jgi:hypothetical protein
VADIQRARRALRKPPRVLARRLAHEAMVEAERVRAPRRAASLDLLRATSAGSIDALWERTVARAPFAHGAPPGLPSAEREHVLARAEDAVARRVDLLGSGPVELGRPIDWLRDFKTGIAWPTGYAPRLDVADLERPSDVKVPWELSRVQWLLPAGQAFLLTGDERYAAAVRDVLDEWIAANPYAWTVNWSVAMESALRILSWSWLLGALGGSESWSDAGFRERFLRTLWLHGDYVERHLERSDVNGNHFTADTAGLVFAGLLFEQGRWTADGWNLLVDELPRQVHPDGVDVEASAAYHRLVFELFLLPALYREQLGLSVPASYRERLVVMARFTVAILDPDGRAPLWGDADDARALPLGGQDVNDHTYIPALVGLDGPASEARWLLGEVDDTPLSSHESASFPDGGVYVLAGERDHVVIDCGPVGLHGRGGHGHNDCLSFEATLDGVKLVTDSGSYVYTASPEQRNRFRATAAHNTPMIDGAEQNRIPESLWVLEDDARPEPMVVEELRFRGSHTGYLRLREPVRPVRTIALDPASHALLVRDEFDAHGSHAIEVPFHLAEGIEPGERSDGVLHLGRFVLRWRDSALWSCEVEEALVSPSYGVKRPNRRVAFRRSGSPAPLTVVLAPEETNEDALWAWAAAVTA